MPARPCLTCGRLTRSGSYCPEHPRPSPSSRATARPGWSKLRAMAMQRDGGACVVCGTTEGLAAHHIIAVADGGPNKLDNIEIRCGRCHREAHRRPQAR